MKKNISFESISITCKEAITKIPDTTIDVVLGISRGGLILAQYLSYLKDVKDTRSISIQLRDTDITKKEAMNKVKFLIEEIIEDYKHLNRLPVIYFTDDLVDTGETIDLVRDALALNNLNSKVKVVFIVNYCDSNYIDLKHDDVIYGQKKPDGWLVFPWDK